MPRKKRAGLVREATPDLLYGDVMVSRLINKVIWEGKKPLATRLVYSAFKLIEEKKKESPLELFKKALENIKPQMEVRSRRIGGANYQVPIEVRPARRMALGLRWLVDASRKRGEKTFSQQLAGEIMDALENKGEAMKRKEETHRMAEANRAFAHYKW